MVAFLYPQVLNLWVWSFHFTSQWIHLQGLGKGLALEKPTGQLAGSYVEGQLGFTGKT